MPKKTDIYTLKYIQQQAVVHELSELLTSQSEDELEKEDGGLPIPEHDSRGSQLITPFIEGDFPPLSAQVSPPPTILVPPPAEESDFYSLWNSVVNNGDSSDRESESDVKSSESTAGLKTPLQAWACKYNIPNTAINSLLGILKPYHPELPHDSRTLKRTPTHTSLKDLVNGQYGHLGPKKIILSKLNGGFKSASSEVELDIFFDGVKLFQNVSSEAWPILVRCVNLIDSRPAVVGIFYGDGKPNPVEAYLADLIAELKELITDGISFRNFKYKVRVRFYLGDAPARAYIKCTAGHSSKHGCERCDEEGVYIDFVVYSTKTGNERTDASFDERRDPEHHKGISPLTEIGAKFISQVRLDPTNLIDIGIFKRFLEFIFTRASVQNRSSSATIFAEFLEVFYKFIPCEFTRKKLFKRFGKWKSKEYRLLLLYLCPVILKFLLREEVYKLYLLLYVAILIMNSDVLIEDHLSDANRFLIGFVKESANIFGREFVVYNVHSALHLASDVARFGKLKNFWAYPFEDCLGGLKKLVQSSSRPLQQVIRRLIEKDQAEKTAGESSQEDIVDLLYEHCNGPVGDLCANAQFSRYKTEQYTLTLSMPDNCVCLSDGRFNLVQNIVRCKAMTVKIVVKMIESVSDFFTFPMRSSDVGVYVVGCLSDDLHYYCISDVLFKCVLLP